MTDFLLPYVENDEMTDSEGTIEFYSPFQRIIKFNCTLDHYIKSK